MSVSVLQNRRIVLGVCGSIAVYKAVDLASKLTQVGALVEVIMTASAQKFVTPLTFQAVTGRAVYTDLWQSDDFGLPTHIAHVGLGEGADLFAIMPATANTLAKLAHGIADDLMSVTALAVRCPVMVAPAMDGGMYDHPATQANLLTLKQRGVQIIEPETGRFASGLTGKGRLPETPALMGEIRRAIGQAQGALIGRHVVVTAGGTREKIDPVRFVSNYSSGKQGYAVAQAALDAGAQVTLISTVNTLPVPQGAQFVPVESALEMQNAVLEIAPNSDVLVMTAAVADFRSEHIADHKIKKQDDTEGMTLNLARNPDILLSVKHQRQQIGFPRVVVGFAAESQDLLDNAHAKLTRKGLDLLVANDITASDAGFAVDTNRVVILSPDRDPQTLPLTTKAHVGEALMARVAEVLLRG